MSTNHLIRPATRPGTPPVRGVRRVFHALAALVLLASAGSAGTIAPMSDEAFFERLDLDRPDLEEVREAVANDAFAAARKALVEHFATRNKPAPRREFPVQNESQDPDAYHMKRADRLLNNVFTRSAGAYDLGDPVDWSAKDVPDGRNFATGINRHGNGSIGSLVTAYRKTGDEKYAEKAIELTMGWIENVPWPEAIVSGLNHELRYAWVTLSTGLRARQWTDYWPILQHYEGFEPNHKIALLKTLAFHGDYLARPGAEADSNWQFMIASGLGSLAVMFPEFENSDHWLEVAMDRIESGYDNQVYPDGMQQELSPSYHRVAIASIDNFQQLLARNDMRFSEPIRDIREKMWEVAMYLLDPLGDQPHTNDANLKNLRPFLREAAERYDRPDMRYVGTGYEEGVPPRHASYALPYGGLYVTRSEWSEDAKWLIFDAGPFGTGHSQEDMLNFELAAYGERLLYDTTNNPTSYAHTAFRWYQMQTESHNTVMGTAWARTVSISPRRMRPVGRSTTGGRARPGSTTSKDATSTAITKSCGLKTSPRSTRRTPARSCS